jgi:endonuclease/exonuclease/phosphatase family metal-dependent hydrolase
VQELFSKGQHTASNGKDAFPRLPLRGHFTCLAEDPYAQPFDFQLLGLHLKSQRGGGGEQRRKAAKVLSDWLVRNAPSIDSDVVLVGDWNKEPGSDDWEAFHRLEERGEGLFKSINDSSDFSHFYYKNKRNLGSRLDLAAITVAAHEELADLPKTVRWTTLDSFLEASPKAKDIKEYIKEVRDKISDHMPIIMRFYFTEQRQF